MPSLWALAVVAAPGGLQVKRGRGAELELGPLPKPLYMAEPEGHSHWPPQCTALAYNAMTGHIYWIYFIFNFIITDNYDINFYFIRYFNKFYQFPLLHYMCYYYVCGVAKDSSVCKAAVHTYGAGYLGEDTVLYAYKVGTHAYYARALANGVQSLE